MKHLYHLLQVCDLWKTTIKHNGNKKQKGGKEKSFTQLIVLNRMIIVNGISIEELLYMTWIDMPSSKQAKLAN